LWLSHQTQIGASAHNLIATQKENQRMGNEEEEEELVAEVEAVEAVYGTDCVLLSSFPPHFHLFLKPRTADVSSQQVFPFSISLSPFNFTVIHCFLLFHQPPQIKC